MKLFLINISKYIALTIIIVTIIIGLCIKILPNRFLGNQIEYIMWKYQKESISNIIKSDNDHINIILGDSRGMASIKPNLLFGNFQNLSVGGGTFFEGCIALKKILKYKKVDTLILCYSSGHFEQSDVLMERTIPYNYIDKEDLKELIEIENRNNLIIDLKNGSTPSLLHNLDRYLIYDHFPLYFRSIFMDNLQNNYLPDGGKLIINNLSSSKGYSLFGKADSTNDFSEESYQTKFKLNLVIQYYFYQIDSLIRKNNIVCYFVTPPICEISYEKNKTKYFEEYVNHLQQLKNKSSIHIKDSIIIYNHKLFGDASHLNAKGATIFTAYIAKLIHNN
jgi:hypothetical protein